MVNSFHPCTDRWNVLPAPSMDITFCFGHSVFICEQLLPNAAWRWPACPPAPPPPPKRVCCRANQSPLDQVHIWVGPLTRPGQPSSHREISNPGKFYDLANEAKLFLCRNSRQLLPLHLNTKKLLMSYITIKAFHLEKNVSQRDITSRQICVP